jgi:putative SOS response-associated peptidase YedK
MCGRHSLNSPHEVIAVRFNLQRSQDLPARYNIAPSQKIPVLRESKKGRELALLKWDLIPPRAKDPNTDVKPINARAETLGRNTRFRNAYLLALI